ncbi:DUF481 domain-containing protein [Chitinimonas lacunae]|uniref:DUF481 domain-containing protein n=1 Tax=Chitinimonas lacunae TaxID=1963018 RepID=A0ABV8MP63_9NEIS
MNRSVHCAGPGLWSLLLAAAVSADTAVEQQPGYDAGFKAGYAAALKELTARQHETPSTPTVPAPAALPLAAPPAEGMPDWWNHSSFLYPNRDGWRHHLEANLSATSLGGNDSGHALRIGGKAYSQIGHWTNELSVSIDKRKIEQVSGGLNEKDYRIVQETLRRDLSPNWYVGGGYIWELDEQNLIDSRHTVLAGVGYYWIDRPGLRLDTFVGLGRFRENYMEFVRDYVGINRRDSDILYTYQTLQWQLAPAWSLRQGFRLINDGGRSGRYVLDPVNPRSGRYVAAEYVHRYRYLASLNLDYQLAPKAVLSFGFEKRYDSNPWPDVLRADYTRRLNFTFQY